MKLTNNLFFRPTFKQIDLQPEEKGRAENILANIKCAVEPSRRAYLTKLMYDVFASHLDNEVKIKITDDTISTKTFSKDLFLQFHKSIKQAIYNDLTLTDIVDKLNKFSSSPEHVMPLSEEPNPNRLMVHHIRSNTYKMAQFLGVPDEVIIRNADFHDAIISHKPAINIENVEESAKVLNIDLDTYKRTVVKHIRLATMDSKVIKDYVERNAKVLGRDEQTVINSFLSYGKMLHKDPEELEFNINDICEFYNLDREDFIEKGIKDPKLFTLSKDDIETRLNFLEEIGLDRKWAFKAVLSEPSFAILPEVKIRHNFDDFMKEFSLDKETALKYISENFYILLTSIKEKKDNLKDVAKLFNRSEDIIFEMACNKPQLFTADKKRLVERLEMQMDILGMNSFDEIVNLAQQKNALLFTTPNRLKYVIDNSSKKMHISRQEFIEAGCINPQIFFLEPESILDNMDDISEAILLPKEVLIKVALKNPAIFTVPKRIIIENLDGISKLLNLKRGGYPDLMTAPNSVVQDIFKKRLAEHSDIETCYPEGVRTALDLLIMSPLLFTLRFDLAESNLENISSQFGINYNMLCNLSKKNPRLLSFLYKEGESWFRNSADALGLTLDEFKDVAIKYPKLFTTNADKIKYRLDILDFKEKATGEKSANKPYEVTKMTSTLFRDVFITMVVNQLGLQKYENNAIFKKIKQGLFSEPLRFELPEHKISYDFKIFLDEFFKKMSFKQDYSVVIKKALHK